MDPYTDVFLCAMYQSPCLVKKLHHTLWFQKFTQDIYDQTTYWHDAQFYDVWNFAVISMTSVVMFPKTDCRYLFFSLQEVAEIKI